MPYSPDKPGTRDAEIFRGALEVLSAGVVLLDRQGKIIFWNDGAEKITGYHRHDAVGHNTQANILPECTQKSCVHCGASCPMHRATHEGKPAEIQGYLHHKAGHSVPVRFHVHPIRDERGSVIAIAQSFEEQGWTIEPEFHQNSLAAHGCLDLVTGVPNHAFTQSHLRENLAFYQEYHLPFGILCIEVGGVSELRTTYGREAVDVTLHVVAQTMKHALRPDGFLGRWTEDQFLAIVTNCGNADLERAAQNVQKIASGTGIQWWDDLLSVSIVVGFAMVQSGDTPESFLARALQPLKKSKTPPPSPAAALGRRGGQAGSGT